MAAVLFLLGLFVPPAVLVLSVAAVAIGSIPRRAASAERVSAHHAVSH
jgi:hypothetical protein